MIFKTFDSDIDKISAKWGIFGKSFNDIGNTIVGRIKDIINGFQATDDLLGSFKNTDSIWKRLYPSKETIQSQMIDIETLFPKQTDEYFSSLLNGLTQQQNLIDKTKGSWSDYFNNLGEGEKWQVEFIQNTDLQKASLDDVKKSYNSARDAAIAHNNALKQQTLGAKAAKIAMNALVMVGNMLATYVITKLITAYSDYKKKLHDVAQEMSIQAKESADYVDSLIELKAELNNGTKSTDELTSAFKAQLETMGYTESEIENLIGEYGNLSKAIDEATRKALEQAATAAYTDVASSGKALTVDSYGGIFSDILIEDLKTGVDELDSEIENILSKVANKTAQSGTAWISKDNSAEGLYEYYNALTEVSRLIQETAQRTDNSSLLDLGFFNKSMFSEVTNAIDMLKDSAESYGDAVERKNKIDAQLNLADYLKTTDINSQESFNKYIEGIKNSTEYSEKYKEVLIEVANKAFPQFTKKLVEMSVQSSDTIENSKSKMIDLINSMSDGFDVLDKIYADVVDGGSFDFTNLDSKKFEDAFSGLKDEYIAFIEAVSGSPNDINACQEAFDDLVTAFINQKGILSNLTDENLNLTVSMLKNMGVANAEELVMSSLNSVFGDYEQVKREAANAGIDLLNATDAEINGLIQEKLVSEETAQALFRYQLQKKLSNENAINTAADCEALIALAKQCQVTGENLELLTKLRNSYNVINSDMWGEETKALAIKEAQKIKDQLLNLNVSASNKATISKPKYTGGTDTAKAKEAQKKAKETFDYFERRIEVLNQSISKLEAGMENVLGADAKNTLLSAQIGIVDEEIRNYTNALGMYQQKADEALSKVDASLRDKIVNGAIEVQDFIGENSDDVVEAMNNYKKWADKISDCSVKLEELKSKIRQLELQKFNNIMEDFNNQFDIYENSNDLISKQISLLEEAGELIGESYYTKQIEQSQKQLNILEAEKKRLVDQLNDSITSGRIQQGTDEWLEMTSTLTDVEGKIIDCKKSVEEFNNELLDLNWKIFERVQTEFGNISTELENLVSLFDDFNDIKVSDGKGTWTKEAIATLGLYAQQYELARYQVAQYSDAIEKLKEDYLAGKYSATEYMDKLAELSQGQWDAVNSAHSLEDAILSLNETRINEEIEGIEKEIDAFKESIDAQLELIEETEKLNDKRKTLAEKSKSVANIEKQLAAMANDNTAATIAKRKKLEEELANAKQDLADTEHDYSIESQKDALNKQYEDYEKSKNDEIENLKLNLENKEQLISDSLEIVKQNTDMIGQQIALIAQEHGITVSNAVITPWTQGENAIASYGETLSIQSSAFIGNLMGVENEVYNLQTEANTASVAISNMFGQRADTLNSELVASYVAEDNLNTMTGILQNSLINTLEGGYNVSGITSAMGAIASSADSVAEAANRAAQALAEMLGAQERRLSVETSIGKNGTKYNVKDIYSGEVLGSFDNYKAAEDYWKKNKATSQVVMPKKGQVLAYAKGGLVTKKDNGSFDPIAKAVGEDTMVAVKHGEGIFTPLQTEGLMNLAPFLDKVQSNFGISNFGVKNNIPDVVQKQQPNVTLHYDKMFEFNGDFNNSEQLLGQMQKVANKVTKGILDDINRDFRLRH